MIIKYIKSKQHWLSAKSVGIMIDQKNPSVWLKRFRTYARNNPDVFYPYKPFVEAEGIDTRYSAVAFGFYFENHHLLEAGTRSIKLSDELDGLKQRYLEVEEQCI